MLIRAIALFLLMSISALAGAAYQTPSANRDADARAIRHEIERIFQAFIDKDRDALVDTHIANWRGYLTGSRSVIKGRDAYMQASVGSGPMPPRGQGMVGYAIKEYDTVFYGDTAVVSFVADVHSRWGEQRSTTTLTLIDVYVKEGKRWVQAASQTSLHPDSQDANMSAARSLGDDEKAALLKAREAVWRAWFAGDEKALRELLPPELVTLDGEGDAFGTLDANITNSLSFAKSGGKLRQIAFPRTEIQAYGNTAIIYTTYALESEMGGQVRKEAGRATEVFVRRGDRWLNTGWQLAPSR
jgi:ketosteroid isomerase-like protein